MFFINLAVLVVAHAWGIKTVVHAYTKAEFKYRSFNTCIYAYTHVHYSCSTLHDVEPEYMHVLAKAIMHTHTREIWYLWSMHVLDLFFIEISSIVHTCYV